MKRVIDADYFIEMVKRAMKIQDGLLGDLDTHLIVAEAAIKLVEEKCFEAPEWHDLRKNPQDLPPDHDMVLVVMTHRGKDTYKTAWHISRNGLWLATDGSYTFNGDSSDERVIAWREIQPFKE